MTRPNRAAWFLAAFGALALLAALSADGQEELDLDALSLAELDALLRAGEISYEGPPPVDGPEWGGWTAWTAAIGDDPGVGFAPPDRSATCWQDGDRSILSTAHLPWGPSGNGSYQDGPFWARYNQGSARGNHTPCGPGAELFDIATEATLKNAFAGRCSGLTLATAGRTGVPTQMEKWDLATTRGRCETIFRACWWELNPAGGGLPSNPVNASRGQAKSFGLCTPGVHAVKSVMCGGWPFYYRVAPETLEGADWCPGTPPPPPPPPAPPACVPYEGSPCAARCEAGAERFGWTREWCLAPEREGSQVGVLCGEVCRDEPDPPPEPEPPPPPPPELECWTGTVTGRFVPGVPSTGRLEVEMFRVDCPEERGGGS